MTVMLYLSTPSIAVHSSRVGDGPTKSRRGVTCSISCFVIAATSGVGASTLSRGVHARHSSASTLTLERNVAMLLGWVLVALVIEGGQRLHQLGARGPRQDDLVHVAALGRHIRAGKPL